MKNSFILYYDFKEEFDLLSEREIGKIIIAVYDYELMGKKAEFKERVLQMVYLRIIRSLDQNKEKYEETCRKNKENGSRGGRPKKETSPIIKNEKEICQVGFDEMEKEKEKTQENPKKPKGYFQKPKKADNDTDTDTEYDNDNDTVYVYDNENEFENDNETVCVSENDEGVFPALQENTHIKNNKNEINSCQFNPLKKDTILIGQFFNVALTNEELEKLQKEFPNSWERRVEELSAYMEYSGKSYNNCYARLLQWKCFDKGKSDEELQKEKDRKNHREFTQGEREASYDIDLYMKKSLELLGT